MNHSPDEVSVKKRTDCSLVILPLKQRIVLMTFNGQKGLKSHNVDNDLFRALHGPLGLLMTEHL